MKIKKRDNEDSFNGPVNRILMNQQAVINYNFSKKVSCESVPMYRKLN